jgi:GT2 family glycosyltransferase
MKLSIVILNWNGSAHLKHFLPSVVTHSNFDWVEIVVADNGSTDDSCALIEREFPTIKLIRLTENYGFAAGYNFALQDNNADYILLLNSDVEVTKNWLNPLVALMDQDPQIGACQPKILSLQSPNHFEYAGASGGFIDRLGYPFCRGRIINHQEEDLGQYNDSTEIFWASGAALLIRGSLWHEAKGFDPNFWAHMEEIDFCWRIKNLGYKIKIEPASTVYHLGGGSLAYGSTQKIFLNFRNNLFLLYKNLPPGQLVKTLTPRMILDGVAAIQFLLTGQFRAVFSVLRAHAGFYNSLKRLKKQRKSLTATCVKTIHPEIYRGSLIYDFYIARKRTFSALKFQSLRAAETETNNV